MWISRKEYKFLKENAEKNILRIEKAKFLLEYSDDPINKIMEIVGFDDFAHFTKLFKKETGYSPTKYRNALKKRIV